MSDNNQDKSKFIFNETPDLGGVVDDVKRFCAIQTNMKTPSYRWIIGDFNNPNFPGLAGNMWSRLCGFTFFSKVVPSPGNVF